jgi:hypothetical protein
MLISFIKRKKNALGVIIINDVYIFVYNSGLAVNETKCIGIVFVFFFYVHTFLECIVFCVFNRSAVKVLIK